MVSVELCGGGSGRLCWGTDGGMLQESLEAGKSCPVVLFEI